MLKIQLIINIIIINLNTVFLNLGWGMTVVYSESSSITSIETPVLATQEMDKNSVNLYPNPSEGDFTLELSNDWNVSTTQIKIVDGLERVLFTKSVENYKTFISRNLKSGVYSIQIQNEKQTLTLKLIIQK